MKRQSVWAVMGIVLLGVCGCGQNVGSTPQETWKLSMENSKEISALLESIKDEATADAAIPKLERAVERHNALTKKFESYTPEERTNLLKDNIGSVISAGGERLGMAIQAGMKVPTRAEKLRAVLSKMDNPKEQTSKSGK